MVRLVTTLLMICLLALPAPAVRAQDYAGLLRDFSAAGLSWQDKRFLQAALAFEGDYSGLLDGAWGRLSAAALDRYARREFGTAAETWHMVPLAHDLAQRIESDGWELHFFDRLGVSLFLPSAALRTDPPDTRFAYNLRHIRSSLRYSIGRQPRSVAEALHDYTLEQSAGTVDPYVLRRSNLAITAVRRRDGARLYTRSDYVAGGWVTVMLAAGARDAALLGAVSASVTPGRAEPLGFTRGGRLDEAIRMVVALLEESGADGPGGSRAGRPQAPPAPADDPGAGNQYAAIAPPPPPAAAPGQPGTISSGSGFHVSAAGHVLTNAHVVEDCTRIAVDGAPAVLVARAETADLALLQTSADADRTAAVFAAAPARLNSDVTAVGYPYADLLGGLNVTRGSVSSMTGLAGDRDTMQITTPVQPGNSGGPLVAADGTVVGVVVAKLDARRMLEDHGDVPQNVNFAIRAEVAVRFLEAEGLTPQRSRAGRALPPEVLAERAASFTAFVTCTAAP